MSLHNTSITLKMISTRSINTDIIVIDVYPTESFPSLMCSRFYFFLGGGAFYCLFVVVFCFIWKGLFCFVFYFNAFFPLQIHQFYKKRQIKNRQKHTLSLSHYLKCTFIMVLHVSHNLSTSMYVAIDIWIMTIRQMGMIKMS